QPRAGVSRGRGRARSRRGVPRLSGTSQAGPPELLAQLRARSRLAPRGAGDRGGAHGRPRRPDAPARGRGGGGDRVRRAAAHARARRRRLPRGPLSDGRCVRRGAVRVRLGNEGAAVAAAEAVAPGFEPWASCGYPRRQYRRIRELDAFLRRAVTPLLEERGLGLRLRFLSGGTTPAARLMGG